MIALTALLLFLAPQSQAKALFSPHEGDSWEWLVINQESHMEREPGYGYQSTSFTDTNLVRWSIHRSSTADQWKFISTSLNLRSSSEVSDTAVFWHDQASDTLGWIKPYTYVGPWFGRQAAVQLKLNRRDSVYILDFNGKSTLQGTFTNTSNGHWRADFTTSYSSDIGWFIENVGWDSAYEKYQTPLLNSVGILTVKLLKSNGKVIRNPEWLIRRFPGTAVLQRSISQSQAPALVGLSAWSEWQRQNKDSNYRVHSASGRIISSDRQIPSGRYYVSFGDRYTVLLIP
jgi:hypothetical protein